MRLRHGTDAPALLNVTQHGAWQGPALELASPDNSFTEVFTPKGAIRHSNSTTDAGLPQKVTLQYCTRTTTRLLAAPCARWPGDRLAIVTELFTPLVEPSAPRSSASE